MAYGILPIPGTEKNIVKNTFDFEIDLSWFPMVATCLSVIGILIGALWIVEPIEKETNSITGKLTFIPMFFYRMLLWLLILIYLDSFSVLAFFCFAVINWITLFSVQNHLEIDPINHSLLSLIFPVYKLPSYEIDSKAQMKIMLFMVVVGNSTLLLFHVFLYYLYFFQVYSPWSNSHSNTLLLPEDVYKNINLLVTALFLAASIPILLTYYFRFER